VALTASISTQTGSPPWSPTHETKLVETYEAYDGPLVGVLAQGGVHFLFWCIAGHVEPTSLWLYAPLDGEDELALSKASTETLDPVLEHIIATRSVVVALVEEKAEEAGIVLTARLEQQAGGSLPSAMLSVLERAQSSWRDLLEPLAC
jgi:hypothetical protein